MKTTLTILILALTLTGYSQDKRFTLEASTLLINEHNTPSIGVAVGYQMELMYFRAGLNFQELAHPEIQAGIGFNFHSQFSDWRYFAGITATNLFYKSYNYKYAGVEFGVEHYWDSFFLGLFGNYVYSDFPLYSGGDMGMVLQGGVKFGFEL